jgi:Flp pilus assembly protein TadG
MKLHCEETRRSERGIIILTFAVSFVFLVLFVGLAVDGGMLYLTKVKLQSAGDAAALAAARSLNLSSTQSGQTTDAQNAATNFFRANFPSGYLSSSSNSITTNLAYGTGSLANTLNIKTTASTSAPTYFMRVFGYPNIPITITGTASRKDVNLILVGDISASMNNGASPSACQTMVKDAALFVQQFSNNRDTVGLVTFNDGTNLYAPTTNFNPTIVNDIDALTCTGDTNTPGGLHVAYQQLQALNNPLKLNVIVMFTDGQAEAIAANFPIKSATDSVYGDNISPYPNLNSLYSMPPSGCSGTVITGTFAENSYDTNGPDMTGWTSGPWAYVQTGSGQGWNAASTIPSGCNATAVAGQNLNGGGGGWNNMYEFRRDVAYIPTTDIYGNSTSGFRTDYNTTTQSISTGQDEWPSGNPYAGRLRTDQPITFFNASANAADNQGATIRSDTTLNPMIMTIGLGGDTAGGTGGPGFPVDAELLIRLANVPRGSSPPGYSNYPVVTITNSNYSSSQAQGMYVYAPDATQLAMAFQQVASFVVELTH